jgi:hypothetical protein
MATKKNIIDSLLIILTRFGRTDDSRFDEDWISYKIDAVAAELKVKEYIATGIIDPTWLSNLGLLTFHKVNVADNPSITCDCDISKTTIPQLISLKNKDGSLDLGLYSLISPCGKTSFYYKRMSQWKYTPPEHTNSLFSYYDRQGTVLYTNKVVEQLKAVGMPLNPEDAYLINSAPVLSGAITTGVVYLVKQGQVIYNGTVYAPNATFTGVVSVTTFVGSGLVYLNSQVASFRDVDPYPASGEMIRAIELEILSKEFGIEMNMEADVRNDSKDDTSKRIEA